MACQLRMRERIVFTPTWSIEFERYAVRYCQKQRWRCDPIHDISDLVQDAYLLFVKLRDYYPRVVDPPHFMALFKAALRNSLHDKALDRKSRDDVEDYLSTDVSENCVGRIGNMSNAGYVAALIAEMPEELRLALNLLAQGLPTEKAQRTGLQPRESLTMLLRRLVGLPINSDPLGMIKRVLT
jgi:hypothetical protein